MSLLAGLEEVAPPARPLPGLSRLINPVDPVTFEDEYWEKAPLRIARDDPGYFADLLTLEDMDQVLALSDTGLDRVRVVADGRETPVTELASSARHNALEAVYEHFRGGSTVIVNSLERRWEPLRRFSCALGADLSARIQMNIYVTPAGNQGFAAHYDTHDVFIAQVHGRKRWRLASQPYPLPLRGQPYDKSQPEPAPDEEFDLAPGDLLYLPRGTVHSATANESTSVHVTVGVHPVLYSEMIEGAVRALFASDVRFRGGLPIGFAADPLRQRRAREMFAELAGALGTGLSPGDMTASAVWRATSIGLPSLRHHLTDLDGLDRTGLGTSVRPRPGLRFTLTVDQDAARLDFHGKSVLFPASVADEIRYLASGGDLTGAAIPGDLDEPGRLLLVRTLLREGFLTRG